MLQSDAAKARKRWRTKPFIMLNQKDMAHIYSNPRLNGNAVRVFMCLLDHIDYNNSTTMTQGDIARKVGTTQAVVSNSIAALKDENLVFVEKTMGSVLKYTLNAVYCLKGERGPKHKESV